MTTTTTTNPLKTLLTLIEYDGLKDLSPVAIGALTVADKSPGAAGLIAAKLYVLGNAPAALLAGEQDFISAVVTDLQSDFTKLQAQLGANLAASQAPPTTTLVSPTAPPHA